MSDGYAIRGSAFSGDDMPGRCARRTQQPEREQIVQGLKLDDLDERADQRHHPGRVGAGAGAGRRQPVE